MKTPLQILIDARKLIDSPEKWTRGRYRIVDGDAYRYCAVGAILYSATCSELVGAERFMIKAAGLKPLDGIPHWNDAPDRTHAEVLRAFDTAIELARNEEAK